MSDEFATTVSEAVQRLDRLDASLIQIWLWDKQLSDADVSELVDRLLAHPDIVKNVWLSGNQLTDETGARLARCVAASTTIEVLDLSDNRLGPATFSAVAQALRINTSLRVLVMLGNQAEQSSGIEAGLVEALRVNRSRPAGSMWWLFKGYSDDFGRLEAAAAELGHASMQALLLADIERASIGQP